jgi:hypothetical protein
MGVDSIAPARASISILIPVLLDPALNEAGRLIVLWMGFS